MRKREQDEDTLTPGEVSHELNKATTDNWDNILTIDGTPGIGKSVLACQIAKAGDPEFTFERNVLFSPDFNTVIKKVRQLPKGSYIVLDEAIKILYKLEWWSEINRLMDKLFNLCRKENKNVILCIPDFTDLSKSFRKLTKLWIHCVDRGDAHMLCKDPFPGVEDKWHLKKNLKTFNIATRYKQFSAITNADIRYALKKTRNYVCSITWDDFNPRERAEYELLRDKVKYDDIELQKSDSQRLTEIKKLRYTLNWLGFNYQQIGGLVGISKSALSHMFTEMDEGLKVEVEEYLLLLISNNKLNLKQITPPVQQNGGIVEGSVGRV